MNKYGMNEINGSPSVNKSLHSLPDEEEAEKTDDHKHHCPDEGTDDHQGLRVRWRAGDGQVARVVGLVRVGARG